MNRLAKYPASIVAASVLAVATGCQDPSEARTTASAHATLASAVATTVAPSPSPASPPQRKNPEAIREWFDDEATNCSPDELHHCSAWRYLTTEEFDAIIFDAADKLDPPIRDGERVYDLGVGVGAALKALLRRHPRLLVGGNDISTKAIAKAKEVFPSQAQRFFVGDMTLPNPKLADASFDHVTSFGALGMYLKKPQMLAAAKEALRITKPGGSLVFTSFIRPGGERVGSIVEAVEDTFWSDHADELGIDNVRIHPMKHQGDRYQVTFRKRTATHGSRR